MLQKVIAQTEIKKRKETVDKLFDASIFAGNQEYYFLKKSNDTTLVTN